jgi:hypothetical protein
MAGIYVKGDTDAPETPDPSDPLRLAQKIGFAGREFLGTAARDASDRQCVH